MAGAAEADGAAPWSAAFAADLHLQPGDRPGLERAERLVALCRERSSRLYFLGDLFDLWTSRALLDLEELQPFFRALRAAADRGLEMVFLPGNRDFNLGPRDGRELGLQVVGEELAVELDGRRLLLTHGDALLLRDVAYQHFKRWIRSPPARFLARHLPRWVSFRMARRLRRESTRALSRKPPEVLQIVDAAVLALLDRGHDTVLCGHVHRAERREYDGGRELQVLPPFLEDGRFLVLANGILGLRDLDGNPA